MTPWLKQLIGNFFAAWVLVLVVSAVVGSTAFLHLLDTGSTEQVFFVGVTAGLWVVGRIAWDRRQRRSEPERFRPRRRALPPAPVLGEGDVDPADHREPVRRA
jgi:hypothetical protein